VAIVGAGPAGLSCAYDLIRLGYPVIVFEASSKAGGLMRWGIPEFRLPRNIVDNEISYIEELGVEIKTNTTVTDLDDIFKQGYKAIYLATGCPVNLKLGIPNENAEGVINALDFLRQVNSGANVKLGNRVAVIGGGNAAVDVARVARRIGAEEVTIMYRRSKVEMPAMENEIEEAEKEGVEVNILTTPVTLLTEKSRLSGLRCVRMELGEPDESGRRRPSPIKGSEYEVPVDNVIVAIGQTVDKEAFKEIDKDTAVKVDGFSFATNKEGVFAGGDVVSGPSDIIGAIGAAKEAAISIDRYLCGVDTREDRIINFRLVNGAPLTKSTKQGTVATFDEQLAIAEARRCLNCGTCEAGLDIGKQPACVSACPAHALYYYDMWEPTRKTGMIKL
jgi:heterodisulfide reductase subunit A